MIYKYLLPAIVFAAAGAASAEDYQLFTNLNANHQRMSSDNYDVDSTNWGLNGTYYFDKKQSLGPLDKFEYINKVSYVHANFFRIRNYNYGVVGGSYVAANGLRLSAFHQSGSKGSLFNSAGIGYLISDNLSVEATASKAKYGGTKYNLSGSYNLQLQGNDYIGFSADTNEKFDRYTIRSEYFASLKGGQFIAANMQLAGSKGYSWWEAGASYYFNKLTSIDISYRKSDDYNLGAKHFLNSTWAVQAGFGGNSKSSDSKTYQLGVVGQF
jgi:hypothetical protein